MTSRILGKTSKCDISSLELRWEVYDPSLERKFYGEYDGRGYGSLRWLFKLAKILGHLGPMTSSNGKNAISRVRKLLERSLTPHWIGSVMEIMMGWVIRLNIAVINYLNTFWVNLGPMTSSKSEICSILSLERIRLVIAHSLGRKSLLESIGLMINLLQWSEKSITPLMTSFWAQMTSQNNKMKLRIFEFALVLRCHFSFLS